MLPRRVRLPLSAGGLICAALVLPGPAGAAPRDVRVLSTAAGEIHFEVVMPAATLAPAEDPSGEARVRVVWPGEGGAGEEGRPALPGRVFQVAVPPEGEVGVSAVGLESAVLDGVRLARDPEPPDGGVAGARAERGREAADGRPGSGGPRVRLRGVSWLRNQRVAIVELTPFDVDAGIGRLTAYRRVEISVVVAAPRAAPPGAFAFAEPPDADPFEPVYRSALVNYEQGRAWRRPKPATALGPPSAIQAAPDTSVFPGRPWLRITVTRTGLYRLDGARINSAVPGFPLGTLHPDSLRLFVWPGVPTLPEDSVCVDCDYREVAIAAVDGDGDGLFESSDYFYFWALGPSDWSDLYPGVTEDSSFFNNEYETRNYYWLTWGTASAPVGGTRKRIANTSGALTGAGVTPTDFPARIRAEKDLEYTPNAFIPGLVPEKWCWQTLGRGQTFTYRDSTRGAQTGLPARLVARFWGTTSSLHTLDVSFNGLTFGRRQWASYTPRTIDTTVVARDGPDTLRVSIPSTSSSSDRVAVAWWELYYRRRFEPVRDSLFFDSPGTDPVYEYQLEPFTVLPLRPRVLDVADPLNPLEIVGGEWDTVMAATPYCRLRFEAAEPAPRRYWVAPYDNIAFVAPSNLKYVASSPNLRSRLNAADYLVIYYDADGNTAAGFGQGADLLLNHRRTSLYVPGKTGPFKAMKVGTSQIYNQFSGGRAEPGAIRSFLNSAKLGGWSVMPTYVILFGDASYDYKNITGRAAPGQPSALMPAFENLHFVYLGAYIPFASDDWIFDADADFQTTPDVYGGRLPVADPSSATRLVRDKLIPYDANPDRSEWKNRFLLVSDDFDRPSPPYVDCIPHLRQTALLDTTNLPASLDRVRVYMHRYPLAPGSVKPQARADLKKAINDGVLVMNYIGHGSPFKIADENVLLNSDAETFTNQRQPNLFVAASCDVGKFNDPAVASLGERLLLHTGGGSIGVISATELGFSSPNVELARAIYDSLFTRDAATAGFPRPLGLALVVGKNSITDPFGIDNRRRYPLLGDPATALAAPTLWTELSLEDLQGAPLTQVTRGQTVVVKGSVVEFPGGPSRPFDGAATVLIEDSAPYDSAFNVLPCDTSPQYYPFTAAPMFHGDVTVSGGLFTARFIVAGDAKTGPRGRVRAYVVGQVGGAAPDSDGVGALTMQVERGTLPSGDDQGPRITLGFPGGATQVRGDAVLRVDLFDESGILITGHNPANSIFVTLDGNTTQRIDITSSFRYVNNSYQQGVAYFPLDNLAPGPHEVTVNAADNLAVGVQAARHRSKASLQFTVTENPELLIVRTFPFPNPVRAGLPARIVVDAQGDSVNCLIRIYTVSGRLVRTLRSFGELGQIQVPWDGLDAEGQALASGVYLYRVQINGRDDQGESSARQSAVAEGRIVVTR